MASARATSPTSAFVRRGAASTRAISNREPYYRRHAAWSFEECLDSYDGVERGERAVLTYLVGEFWRRIGDDRRAGERFERVVTRSWISARRDGSSAARSSSGTIRASGSCDRVALNISIENSHALICIAAPP